MFPFGNQKSRCGVAPVASRVRSTLSNRSQVFAQEQYRGNLHIQSVSTLSAVATVNEVDATKGKVILAHEAIQSLNWPPMPMGFTLKERTLFGKLVVGKQVHVDIKKEGAEYVVIGVR